MGYAQLLELKHLATLAAIQKTGSLAKAASQLHVTQSALSHQLRELETVLNQVLIIRKTKPLRFTEAGQRLLTLAHTVLPLVDEAAGDLERLAKGTAGRLHLALECHSCFEWLLPTLEAYQQQFPGVDVDIKIDTPFAPLDALLDGRVDVVVSTDPIRTPGISYESLFRYEIVLIVAPGHALAERSCVEPAQLEGELFATYPVELERLDVCRRFLQPAGVTLEERQTAELTLMLIQLVATGRAVAALPSWAVEEARARGVVQILRLGQGGLWSDLFVASRSEDRSRDHVQRFIGIARETSLATLKGIQTVPEAGK